MEVKHSARGVNMILLKGNQELVDYSHAHGLCMTDKICAKTVLVNNS